DIEQVSNDRYKINGNNHQVNVSVRITELPIRVWTQNYKESLELWISGTDKCQAGSSYEYKEDHTTTTVDFMVKLSQTSLRDSLEEGLEKPFKMSTTIGTSNM
ncbi:7575_t:CDS:2, partial [Funneliformis mosseae]